MEELFVVNGVRICRFIYESIVSFSKPRKFKPEVAMIPLETEPNLTINSLFITDFL